MINQETTIKTTATKAPYWDGEQWIGAGPHRRAFTLDEEEEIHERCRATWERHCNRNGFMYQQPSSIGYYVNGFYTLANVGGVLATFRVYADRVARRALRTRDRPRVATPRWDSASQGAAMACRRRRVRPETSK